MRFGDFVLTFDRQRSRNGVDQKGGYDVMDAWDQLIDRYLEFLKRPAVWGAEERAREQATTAERERLRRAIRNLFDEHGEILAADPQAFAASREQVHKVLGFTLSDGRPRLRPGCAALWRATIHELDDYTCVYCGRNAEMLDLGGATIRLQLDHVFPRSKGGVDFDFDNIVTACRECNAIKGARGVAELRHHLASLVASIARVGVETVKLRELPERVPAYEVLRARYQPAGEPSSEPFSEPLQNVRDSAWAKRWGPDQVEALWAFFDELDSVNGARSHEWTPTGALCFRARCGGKVIKIFQADHSDPAIRDSLHLLGAETPTVSAFRQALTRLGASRSDAGRAVLPVDLAVRCAEQVRAAVDTLVATLALEA